MRRREFIVLLGGAAAAWPLAVRAQRSMPVIGVLVVGIRGSEKFWRLFQEDLSKRGYVEGKTVRFQFRSDQGKLDQLPALARDLAQLKPDVIVTWFTPAATAAAQATREIPIVMAVAGDPIATGLVKSLSQPGGNVTGMSGVAAELSSKLVEYVREMLPSAHQVAALANALGPFSKPFLEQVRLAGSAIGIGINPVLIREPRELDAAFAVISRERSDAVIVDASLP
jgi:putative tryptophan/tyrosine transport system substrate-binding protein